MQLIDAKNIVMNYGDRELFSFDTLKIYSGDRIGIVGNNGEGKSTLLKILIGELEPSAGKLKISGNIAYIPQLLEKENKYNNLALSQGEMTRQILEDVFKTPFDVLAADEPTSNLDISSQNVLLEKLFLVETMLLISHDESLLQTLCNKIIDIKDGKLEVYACGYDDYVALKQNKIDSAIFEYEKYTKEKQRIINAAALKEKEAVKIKKAPTRMGNSEARLHKGSTSEKQGKILQNARQISSRLERLEEVEKPKGDLRFNLDFSIVDKPQNKIIIYGENINISINDKVLFDDASFEIPRNSRTALLGSNGSGKSTLINRIIERANNISVAPKAKLGHFAQGINLLDFNNSILNDVMLGAVQSQTFVRLILANLGFRGESVHKKISALSGGELVKLRIAKLIVSDCNVLILDEPTNFLDLESINNITDTLKRYDGTILFVSHDKNFVKNLADRIIEIKDKKLVLL